MMTNASNLEKRYFFLDNLKVILIALMILDHVAVPFIPTDMWFYTPSNPHDVIPHVFNLIVLNSAFIMVIFFFISGYFFPYSYDRNGAWNFLKKKAIRLVIPVVLGSLIFKILLGRFDVYQLWYLEILFLLSLVYIIFRKFLHYSLTLKDRKVPTVLNIWCLCFVVGCFTFIIRRYSGYFDYKWIFGVIMVEPVHYPQYITMFALGVLSYRYNWIFGLSNKKGIIFLILGLFLGVGIFMRDFYYHKWFTFYESFLSINMGIGLIWLFREYGNFQSRFFQWCSKQTFGAYIFHAFIIYGYEMIFDSILMSAYVKYFCVGSLTVVSSFIFTYLIRKIPIIAKVI